MNSVCLKNIKFSYDNSNPILDLTSFNIESGEKVFIHGPSGSGKSTLLNILTGIIKPQEGSVSILKNDITKFSLSKCDKFRGDNIGYIFQSFNLIPYLTVYENIELPFKSSKVKRESTKNAKKYILKLLEDLKLLPQKDQNVSQLSIGQQQRVAVARALIGKPKLIIADEPTSSLDDEVTSHFMKILLEKHKAYGFTLIFVSHDKRLSQYFDKEVSLVELNKAGK